MAAPIAIKARVKIMQRAWVRDMDSGNWVVVEKGKRNMPRKEQARIAGRILSTMPTPDDSPLPF